MGYISDRLRSIAWLALSIAAVSLLPTVLLQARAADGHPGKVAFTIPEKDLIPEGLAYDRLHQAFYIGSTHRNKIMKIDRFGRAQDFTSEGQNGLYQVLGMKVDAKRRTLWACSAAESENKKFDGCSGIFLYDLREGKLLKKYLLGNEAGPHLFNDIVITAAADAFFTDSRSGAVYSIAHNSDAIVPFSQSGTFSYPNGIALSPDETTLFVADAKGVFAINRTTKAIRPLAHPEGDKVGAIDGMYFYQNSLIGIQTNRKEQRVVRLFLDPTQDRIERVEMLDVNNPLFDIPTTGAVVGDRFYFIGNSQMSKVDDAGNIRDSTQLQPVRILVLKL